MSIERRQLKSGAFRHVVNVKLNGRRHYVGSFGTRQEAVEAEQEFLVTRRKVDRGELPPELDTRRVFGDAVDAWLASLKKRRSRSEDGYRKRVDYYLRPRFGEAPLASITAGMVEDFRDDMAVRYAPSTVNGMVTCLSSAFRHFHRRGWVQANPCHGVKPVEDPQTSYNWIRTKAEITQLLAACNDELRDMVAVGVGTGLRLDEMLHLHWVDVDLRARLLTVHRGRQGTVKSGRVRHVPMLDAVLPVLQRRALRRAGATLVFPGRAGKVRTKQGVGRIYKLALRRAGLDDSLRWHDLRHTFASHWVLDGGDIFRLSKILGHSSVRITEQRYAHLIPEAWEQDYHRVRFAVPDEPAKIYDLQRDEAGRIVGRRAATGPR